MKKFIALLIKKKGKTATNEWGNDGSDIIRALYSVYKKYYDSFSYLLVNFFKERYIIRHLLLYAVINGIDIYLSISGVSTSNISHHQCKNNGLNFFKKYHVSAHNPFTKIIKS